ncbi:TetR family transcriptional regulator [Rhodococcus sp. HNM0569]|uniref:TetR/AcrR family transcriptional regulator n=1 Tax=Rhodococcus sp. HNM0569 TaxID=2716340 RepID=UPI00146B4C21|nr:TetR family transcriptional regulator [Rhodococcus sp. HNM0569]NLU84743.1 TetR/AcrR family transcriptional regulator [Rhodococcus sp. HNM0569]
MPLSNGRLALLDSAEKLIARRGIHGVSAREVLKDAGQRNNSAIAYHFGSWHGLLDQIWSRHAPRINVERAALVASDDERPELERLVHAYVHPLTTQVGTHDPSYWARFNEQWLATAPLDVLAVPTPESVSADYYPSDDSLDVLASLLNRIAAALPLPTEHGRRRVGLMVRFVIGSYAAWERARDHGDAPDLRAFEGEIERIVCAMLGVPPA